MDISFEVGYDSTFYRVKIGLSKTCVRLQCHNLSSSVFCIDLI